MSHSSRPLLRPRRARHWATLTAALGSGLGISACYDDNGYELDQPSGATTSRSGSSSTTGGKGSAGSNAVPASSGMGGNGDLDPDYPEPKIDSLQPESGAYGTLVTIQGEGLGNPGLAGFTLVLGDERQVELTPQDDQAVVSWSDEQIVFRYPFPAEGSVLLDGPRGSVVAGSFTPTWHVARELEQAPTTAALAAVSPAPGRVAVLFDTMPPTLLDVGPDGVVEHAVTAPGIEPSSLRLYLNASGLVEGVAVSNDAEPVIVHLTNEADDLVGVPTTIELLASELAIAGGSAGAAVWMKRAAGWHRARPSGATWKLDKGPISDPEPNAPDRASGASSDGSLYLGRSEDASFLTDDMEAPYMARLTPTGAQFGAPARAGAAVDDYVSSLTLTSSGDGLVVRVCGSDVDPLGFSGTDRYCYDGLHAPGGAQMFGVQVDAKASAHAFTQERAVAAYCSSDRRWFIRTDLDEEEMPGEPIGEPVLFPCPEAVALEVSGEGDYLPVVRWASKTYLLERNPAAIEP